MEILEIIFRHQITINKTKNKIIILIVKAISLKTLMKREVNSEKPSNHKAQMLRAQ